MSFGDLTVGSRVSNTAGVDAHKNDDHRLKERDLNETAGPLAFSANGVPAPSGCNDIVRA